LLNGAVQAPRKDVIPGLQYIDVSKRKYNTFKRAMDIVIAVVALLILLLPLLIVMLCVYIDNPGKVIFAQERIGRNGKSFRIFKVRTMVASAPRNLSAAEFRDADRYVTRLGSLLRKTSLDELPQLINVIKGDMSIVGPRPLIAEESRVHMLRRKYGVYQTRPGITGLAQINGRNNVSTVDKVRWEVKYLERYGFLEDVRIMFATVPKILRGSDVKKDFSQKPSA